MAKRTYLIKMLIAVINLNAVTPRQKEALEDILNILNAKEDTGLKNAKGKAILTGDILHEPFNKTKTVMICSHCNSDNVQVKAWIKPNEDNKLVDLVEGDVMGWCNDCKLPSVIDSAELKANAKVIGFQVVGEDGTSEEGMIHPNMDASFCLYSLSQAQAMLNSNVKGLWRLLTIWSGDVEEPAIMFNGDPRN